MAKDGVRREKASAAGKDGERRSGGENGHSAGDEGCAKINPAAFLRQCIDSGGPVDVYLKGERISRCQILDQDAGSMVLRLGDRLALVYKSAVQAIIADESPGCAAKIFPRSPEPQHFLADVRAQYLRHLAQNRAGSVVKGN